MSVVHRPSPVFHSLHVDVSSRKQTSSRYQLNLVFDDAYHANQELGVMIGDEVFFYRVKKEDLHVDVEQTGANVARGVLAALVNSGFNNFPRTGAVLTGNVLTLAIPCVPTSVPAADSEWACAVWGN